MIITREFAETLDRKKLAELATEYANKFARKLGNPSEIAITPDEVVFDPEEAKRIFYEVLIKICQSSDLVAPDGRLKGLPPHHLELLKTALNGSYAQIVREIETPTGFVKGGIAYIPICGLSDDEKNLLAIMQRKSRKTIAGYSYASLYCLEAEIGHIVGERLYGEKAKQGLGETIDTFSHRFRISVNVRNLGRMYGISDADLIILENELLEPDIEDMRGITKIYKSLFFGTIENFKRCVYEYLMKKGTVIDYDTFPEEHRGELDEILDNYIETLKQDYVYSHHLEGTILFFEILDRAGSLDKAYRRLNELLSNPAIDTAIDALKEFGLSEDEIVRYGDVFKLNPAQRLVRFQKCIKQS